MSDDREMIRYSPDGRWWWDGQQWLPMPQQQQPVAFVTVDATHRTNHTFHLLMTVFTLGLWSPIWLLVWIVNANKKGRP